MRDKYKVEYYKNPKMLTWRWRVRRIRDWAVICTGDEKFLSKGGAYGSFCRFIASVAPNITNINEE